MSKIISLFWNSDAAAVALIAACAAFDAQVALAADLIAPAGASS